MNTSEEQVKERDVNQAAGVPEADKEWQPPRLTVWQVIRDTRMGIFASKTGSGADSHGMRETTSPT